MIPQDAPEHPAPETDHEIAGFGFEFGTGVSVAARPALAPVAIDEGPVSVKVKLLVTRNRGNGFLRRIGQARGGDRQRWRRRQILRRSENPTRADRAARGPRQPAPFSAQVTPPLGLPAERIPAWNVCWAPSSVAALLGDRAHAHIAEDGDDHLRGFARVGRTRGLNIHRWRRGKDPWREEQAASGNRSHLRIAAGDAVDRPSDGGVCCV